MFFPRCCSYSKLANIYFFLPFITLIPTVRKITETVLQWNLQTQYFSGLTILRLPKKKRNGTRKWDSCGIFTCTQILKHGNKVTFKTHFELTIQSMWRFKYLYRVKMEQKIYRKKANDSILFLGQDSRSFLIQ